MMGEEEWDLCALLGLPSLPEPWPSLPDEDELATWAQQASSSLQQQVGSDLHVAVPDISVDELTVDELCLEELGVVGQLYGGTTSEGNADEGGYDSGIESIFSTLETVSISSSPSPSSCHSFSPPSYLVEWPTLLRGRRCGAGPSSSSHLWSTEPPSNTQQVIHT